MMIANAAAKPPDGPAIAAIGARAMRRGVVPVEVDEQVLELILRLHWLPECDAADRGTIGRAIAAMPSASALLERLADAATR
jgi:hypothetical protein